MKYQSTVIAIFVPFAILLFACINTNAQYVSPYDKNGNRRSAYDKSVEETRNRNIKPYKPETVPVPRTSTPSYQPPTAEQKVAAEQETKRQYQLDTAAAGSNKRYNAAKEATMAAALASFKRKVAKYDFVDGQISKGNEVLVILNRKYGFVNALGDEIVPLIYDTASRFIEGTSCVRSGAKWGYINNTGKAILPLQYEEAGSFNNGLAQVKQNGKWGYINLSGIAIIPMIYDNIKSSSYGLYPAKFKGLWGFIDRSGNSLISFEFDDVLSGHAFPASVAVHGAVTTYSTAPAYTPSYFEPVSLTATVVKGNLRFQIDTTGAVIGKKTDINTGKIFIEKKQTGSFTDVRDNKTYGTIKIGTQVWMSENLDVSQFAFGEKIEQANSERAWKKAAEKEKPAWCYYNNDSEIGKLYGKLYNYYAVNSGLAPKGWHIPTEKEWEKLTRFLGGNKVGGEKLRSASGWNQQPPEQDESGFEGLPGGSRGYQNEFLGIGTVGNWWGLRDSKFVFKSSFELWPYNIMAGAELPGYGLAVRCINNEEDAPATANAGAPASSDVYKQPGLKAVKIKKKYGFADESGKVVIDPIYDYASDFMRGYASLFIKNKTGFMDSSGRVAIPVIYDKTLWCFSEGYVGIKQNNKWGFADTKNNIVIPLIYDAVKEFSEGLAEVQLNNKVGFVDKTGKVIVPIKYDIAGLFTNGLAEVNSGDMWGYVDKNGYEVVPLIYDRVNGFKGEKLEVILNGRTIYLDINGK